MVKRKKVYLNCHNNMMEYNIFQINAFHKPKVIKHSDLDDKILTKFDKWFPGLVEKHCNIVDYFPQFSFQPTSSQAIMHWFKCLNMLNIE